MVTRDEAAQLAAGNSFSFLHVCRSDIDLPADTDPYDARVYEKARQNLVQLLTDGTFVRDPEPSFYIYALTMDGRTQVGVVGCVHVEDYDKNVIRRHEKTRKDKEDDRTRHILTLNAHAEPVLLTHAPNPFLAQANNKVMRDEEPLYDFTGADGVRQQVWRVANPAPLLDAFRRMNEGYVADGHHRCASALRAAQERAGQNFKHTGTEEYNWFLAAFFPANQLRILSYNRVVKDLVGMTPEAFLDRLRGVGTLVPSTAAYPEQPGAFGIYVGGAWYRLTLDPESIEQDDPTRSLDVSLLQERVLTPILGIVDVRTDPRIDFVGGGRGIGELARRVDAGEAAVAFAMHPVTVQQLMAIADAGQIMPPKSTWFEPKLKSGLFVHTLD